MTEVFIASDNILSPIGSTTAENFAQLKKNVSGIKLHHDETLAEEPFYASLFLKNSVLENEIYTKFEQLLIASIGNALENSGIDTASHKTVLIISSTKGNISLLETEQDNPSTRKRVSLHHSAKLIADHFHFVHQPVVVSNACISGVLAMLMGMRLIQSGQYENAVIAGADVISKFVLSGFLSFQAISPEPCRPFDETRNGINLGEGAGTIILSSNKKYAGGVKIRGGGTSNDANHISGPSRSGEELYQAITKGMNDAGVSAGDIDLISAHGTATLYNDEMEAKAITMAGMQEVPVNSLKGYYGHTLGAAGIIESIVSTQSLKENILLPTIGFKQQGVTTSLNILNTLQTASLKNCLKTASGFGGCNAAVIFSKP